MTLGGIADQCAGASDRLPMSDATLQILTAQGRSGPTGRRKDRHRVQGVLPQGRAKMRPTLLHRATQR